MSAGALLLTLVTSLPVISSTNAFSSDEIKRIEQGEILVKRGTPKDGEGVTARMVALIAAPVSKVALPCMSVSISQNLFLERSKARNAVNPAIIGFAM